MEPLFRARGDGGVFEKIELPPFRESPFLSYKEIPSPLLLGEKELFIVIKEIKKEICKNVVF